MSELDMVVDSLSKQEDVKGIIITGAGPKAFVAGADISEFKDYSNAEALELSKKGQRVFRAIELMRKPVIAAVNGFALGGGCELAMACHMRVASDNARFGQPEVNLGLVAGYGGTQRLVQLIGKGKATELLLTGDMIKADEAHRLSLVNHVVSQEELMGKCMEILNKIIQKGPVAVANTIEAIDKNFLAEDGFEAEAKLFADCFDTDDYVEGTTAFLEKRKANFTGK